MADSESSESAIMAQTRPQQSTIMAHAGGVAVVPQLHSCHIEGPVNINVNTSSVPVLNSGIIIKRVSEKLKANLRNTFGSILEGVALKGTPTLLNDIYTKLYIIQGEREGTHNEHEVWDIDSFKKPQSSQVFPIDLNDIFKPLPDKKDKEVERHFRVVLTKGIAGIGKTVSVHKFILDWAEGKANQDVDLMIVLPFRDLNTLIEDKEGYSLQELLEEFYPELKDVRDYENCNIVLIFDGLDESKLPLNFQNNRRTSNIKKKCSVDVLLTNLIQADRLLPSARVWITSRPAAVHKVSNMTQTAYRLTEMQGFNDPQKEEYIRKKILDENLANRVISHIKTSRSLHIMCHIPVFCWISATVFSIPRILDTAPEHIPTSVTAMYTRFLVYQTQKKNEKYYGTHETLPLSETDIRIILKLGKLAFTNLEKQNLVFSENDLREHDIDVTDVSVKSGVFTEVVKEEDPVLREKWYGFVHLTLQEYLAAFFIFYSFAFKRSKSFSANKTRLPNLKGLHKQIPLLQKETLHDLHKTAIYQALYSTKGHLDLFLRFLLGLSVEESLWKHFQLQTTKDEKSIKKTSQLIIAMLKEEDERKLPSPERCINLFHCLTELKDNSLVKEIQKFMTSMNQSSQRMSAAQCTALAYMITTSDEVIEEFDLRKYNTTREGRKRLIPVVGRCITAKLCGCEFDQEYCDSLVKAMAMPSIQLKNLDVSYNFLTDVGVEKVLRALLRKKCELETLRLCGCEVTKRSCVTLSKVLQQSSLRELDLSSNNLGDEGVKLVCTGLMSPHCRLQTLGLKDCNLCKSSCSALAPVLWSFSELKHLDLSDNDLLDTGLRPLAVGLRNSNCSLRVLRMSGCQITDTGCLLLALALIQNPHHLEELDLSYNSPGELGKQLLSARLEDQHCHLQKLNMEHAKGKHQNSGLDKYAVDLTFKEGDGVDLSEDRKTATRRMWEFTEIMPEFYRPKSQIQVQCVQSLSGERFYWEVNWTGKLFIGVRHGGSGRRSASNQCEQYFLMCSREEYLAYYTDQVGIQTVSEVRKPLPDPHRIGVYLDWPAGILSFYSVFSDRKIFLHTFHTTFSTPVVPFFIFARPGADGEFGSVTLCTLLTGFRILIL